MEVFRYGTTLLIAALPDHIEDNAATSTIRYAMMAVGDDAEKLRILVNAIYDKETDHGDCIATLLVSLIRNIPGHISAYVGSKTPQKLVAGSELARFLLLTRCQTEHEDTMQSGVWLTKSFFVTVGLYKLGCVTDRIIQHSLLAMAESDNLFDAQNFAVFAKSIVECGPKLEQNVKVGDLPRILNTALARASSKSISCQLMVAGLLAASENDWKIETAAAPEVLTPPERDSEIEMEVKVKSEEGAEA